MVGVLYAALPGMATRITKRIVSHYMWMKFTWQAPQLKSGKDNEGLTVADKPLY